MSASNNITEMAPRLVGEGFLVDRKAVLENAKDRCEFVLVIGRDKNGGSPYVACSHGQAEAIAEIEVAKHWLLSQTLEARS